MAPKVRQADSVPPPALEDEIPSSSTSPPIANGSAHPPRKLAYPLPHHLSHETVTNVESLLRLITLGLISAAAIGSRLFAVIRFESVIHEFDPWFNFRASKVLVNEGFYEFWNWFDPTAWYPLGRVVGGTIYPGLMVTSGLIWSALRMLNMPVDIRNVCVMLAPAFSGLTAVATYL